jgi:adenylate cyclase
LRIGINLGDAMVEGQRPLWRGVNLAARLESLPSPAASAFRRCPSPGAQQAADAVRTWRTKVKNIVGPVHAYRAGRRRRADRGVRPPEIPLAAPTLPNKLSIAVLPFITQSNDPEQEYFADGMVEDIITALSRSTSCSSPAIRASPTWPWATRARWP